MESSKEEKSPEEREMEDKTEALAEALQAMEEKIFHYEKNGNTWPIDVRHCP